MSVIRHEQTRVLQRQLALTLLKRIGVFVLAFVLLCLTYNSWLMNAIATEVADLTSDYVAVNEDQVEDYLFASGKRLEHLEIRPVNENGQVIIRDLSTYYFIKSLKWPFACALLVVGCTLIAMQVLRRSVGYFEELSDSVSDLMDRREKPVRLSSVLALEQSELNELREEALNHERTAAEAERRKNELVAYLAHDIRTPFTSVVGYLSLLDEAPDLPDEQRRRYVSTALAKAETLDALTTEFFEITRYNLSSIPIERSDVEVRLFLEQIADEFMPEAQARRLSLRVDAPARETMRVDGDKLARALGNVVRNALAYADAGTEVALAGTKAHGGGWLLSVTDQGREIAPEHLESVFDRFFRADDARASTGNAGLGLAIAREIVQAHGGTIRAESAGGSTTFTIELP